MARRRFKDVLLYVVKCSSGGAHILSNMQRTPELGTKLSPPSVPAPRISPAALRMRRARERRRQGDSIVSLQVGSGAIADLIALGWLAEVDSANKDAITRALIDLLRSGDPGSLSPAGGLTGPSLFHMRPPAQHDRDAGHIWVACDRSAA